MSSKFRIALCILTLAFVTCVGLAYSKSGSRTAVPTPFLPAPGNGLRLEAKLVQDKILLNGDGTLALAITLHASPASVLAPETQREDVARRSVDLVVVLDRSGSMHGQKINDSRRAVIELLVALGPDDRFGLVSYADAATRDAALTRIDATTRGQLMASVAAIQPGGNTNLAAGLQEALAVLRSNRSENRNGKIILISDGLANRGVTDPEAIASIASAAVSQDFGVSALGVGADFNELLMTRIADKGAGAYYYLEDPQRIASVFLKEAQETKIAAARNIEIRIPLPDGVQALDAAGYPIEKQGNHAVFRAGDLLPGCSRTLHVTLRAPTNAPRQFEIKGVSAAYHADGRPFGLTLDAPLRFACAPDPNAVAASIDKQLWERKAMQEDLGKLKEQVAQDLRQGDEKGALSKIDAYKAEKAAVNQTVGSVRVQDSLERDVNALASAVKDTFAGAPAQVEEKQKRNAKNLQHESYTQRRDKS